MPPLIEYDAWFGPVTPGQALGWRSGVPEPGEDDDVPLAVTPSDVTALLGFDPLEIEKAFDPNQPRDDHGRWSETGAPKFVDGGYGAEQVDVAGTVTPEERAAASRWTTMSYKLINQAARSGDFAAEADTIKNMDALIAKTSLNRDLTLYRQIELPQGTQLVPGQVLRDLGYAATTTSGAKLWRNGGKPIVLVITAPKGSHVLHVEAAKGLSFTEEVVLPRGSRLHIESVQSVAGAVQELDRTIVRARLI